MQFLKGLLGVTTAVLLQPLAFAAAFAAISLLPAERMLLHYGELRLEIPSLGLLFLGTFALVNGSLRKAASSLFSVFSGDRGIVDDVSQVESERFPRHEQNRTITKVLGAAPGRHSPLSRTAR